MALLRFKHAYRAAGLVPRDDELPDHLAVVLEFAATGDPRRPPPAARAPRRAGAAAARARGRRLAVRRVLRAVRATLPPLRGDERDAVRRLAREGPAGEEVGLAPFARPSCGSPRAPTILADADVPGSQVVNELLFVVFPYICLTVFVVGHVWRYRYDKFGWTTRSSQLYENRLLRIGSPLFHFGIIGVFFGHVVGLGIPESWTEAVGIHEGLYHFLAVSVGALAGLATVVGMAILIYRRRTTGPVFSATTRMDKVMYLFLAAVILLGLFNTVVANLAGDYDYREGVSIWFRGIFRLRRTRS
jgi:nitrate reductase gamma subunit